MSLSIFAYRMQRYAKGGCKSEDLPLPSVDILKRGNDFLRDRGIATMILSNPVGWVRDGEEYIFSKK